MQWQYRPSLATGIGFANENVWSRSARRRQQQQQQKDRKDRKDINTGERHRSEEEEEEEEEEGKGEEDDEIQDDQDQDEDEDEDGNEDEDENEAANPPKLGFKIKLSPAPIATQDGHEKNNIGILIRWIIGNDSVIFESFCGMLRNQMMTSTTTRMAQS